MRIIQKPFVQNLKREYSHYFMEQKVTISAVRNISKQILIHVGVSPEHTEIIVDSIVYAHQSGKGTHGLGRLPLYVKKIQAGFMAAETSTDLVKDTPVLAVMDAKNGFGQVAATKAMDLCINKANYYGIGLVGVRRSNNFGTASFITEQAAAKGMIGIVLGNSGPAIAPTGGSHPLFGTNPLGIAFPNPAGDFPISLDMATSVVARGKVRQAAKSNEKIPFGWALDGNGQPTCDPFQALEGSMIPIGDHKGYGLSLAIDILAGLLTGSAFGGDVHPLGDMSANSNYGHLCMTINVDFFMTIDEWSQKIAYLVSSIKSCGDPEKIRIHGESSHRSIRNSKEYVLVKNRVINDIESSASSLGIEVRWT